MTPTVIVIAALVLLIALILVRVPVAYSLILSSAAGLLLIEGSDRTARALSQVPYQSLASFSLLAVPLFILMGEFAQKGSMARDAFQLMARATGRLPGGLAIASVGACAIFGAISGSSIATVASIGKISIREMRTHGYDKVFAAGVVGVAGTLGVMIPPSIILVLYGILSGVSIGQLFVAAIIPGLLSAVVYGVAIVVKSLRNPALVGKDVAGVALQTSPTGAQDDEGVRKVATATTTRPPPKERVSVQGVIQIAVVFVVVMGGIYAGVFTAAEAAGVGAVLAGALLLLDGFRDGSVVWLRAFDALRSTAETTGMTLLLVVGGSMLTYLMVVAGIPRQLATSATSLDVSPWLVVALLLLVFLPLGMVLDPISVLIVTVPIMYPTIDALGFDGVWFGILAVKMVEIGLITPPVGLNAFVVAGTTPDISVEEAFRGVLTFLPWEFLIVVLLFIFPSIVLWLPSLVSI